MSMDEGGSQKKKKKIRQIVESDEESDQWLHTVCNLQIAQKHKVLEILVKARG